MGDLDFNQQRGSDLLYENLCNIRGCFTWQKMEIDLQKQIQCDICNGSGSKPGTNKKTCVTCNGQGQVRQTRNMGFASFVTAAPCSSCRGQGSIIETPCGECKGQGKKKGSKTVHI